MKQATRHLLMIRPKHFGYDPVTADSNAFQQKDGAEQEDKISSRAIVEFDQAVSKLRSKGVAVTVIDDTEAPIKPNAVFPNNWVSFHNKGIILYPMMAENRRWERRMDIIDTINEQVKSFEKVVDLSDHEKEARFLESTGSIIFDYVNDMAYACLSPRTDEGLFRELCDFLDYEPIIFHARDADGQLIYHTNVMMCLASQYALICMDCIDENERAEVAEAIERTKHELISISMDQVYEFAGNMLEVEGAGGQSYLVMSQSAFRSLTQEQIKKIQAYSEIISIDIPTIEKYGGGSIRCMMCRVY